MLFCTSRVGIWTTQPGQRLWMLIPINSPLCGGGAASTKYVKILNVLGETALNRGIGVVVRLVDIRCTALFAIAAVCRVIERCFAVRGIDELT